MKGVAPALLPVRRKVKRRGTGKSACATHGECMHEGRGTGTPAGASEGETKGHRQECLCHPQGVRA
jgi:hypothetical protein